MAYSETLTYEQMIDTISEKRRDLAKIETDLAHKTQELEDLEKEKGIITKTVHDWERMLIDTIWVRATKDIEDALPGHLKNQVRP